MPPRGVCVKAAHLRPKYTDLEDWMSHPGNVLLARHGRVFVNNLMRGRHVFAYPASPWANPFKLSDYSLDESLRLYRRHLLKMLEDDCKRRSFLELRNAAELGCFCDPGSACHRDVVLEVLAELQTVQSRTESQPKMQPNSQLQSKTLENDEGNPDEVLKESNPRRKRARPVVLEEIFKKKHQEKRGMVHYKAGTVVECDPAIMELLMKINKEADIKFIIDVLDPTHLLVTDESVERIQKEVEKHLERE